MSQMDFPSIKSKPIFADEIDLNLSFTLCWLISNISKIPKTEILPYRLPNSHQFENHPDTIAQKPFDIGERQLKPT